jgi:hypothetical protein
MGNARVKKLIDKLRKGGQKTQAYFESLSEVQWQAVLYADPYPWTVRDLLAHFFSAEEGLLQIAQNVASGGPGAPQGLDHDAFNADEQERLADRSPRHLLADLARARRTTIAWVSTLQDETLDLVGRHPALGEISLETMIMAIYGHQLLHVRDLNRFWKGSP